MAVPGLSVEAPAARTPETGEVRLRSAAKVRPLAPVQEKGPAPRISEPRISTPSTERDLQIPGPSSTARTPVLTAPPDTPVTAAPRRTNRTEGRLQSVVGTTPTRRSVEEPSRDLNIQVPGKTGETRNFEEVQGAWQRMENLGPLSHLNALCFGRSPDEFVYHEEFRLRCDANQIIEGWRRKEVNR